MWAWNIVCPADSPLFIPTLNPVTAEKMDSDNLLRILQKRILSSDSTVTGFNVGMNSGESAGQTIFHAHIHLIPRRDGDTPNPRGGGSGCDS